MHNVYEIYSLHCWVYVRTEYVRAVSARAVLRCDHVKKVTQRREEYQECWLDRKVALANRSNKRKVEEERRQRERKEREINEYRWDAQRCRTGQESQQKLKTLQTGRKWKFTSHLGNQVIPSVYTDSMEMPAAHCTGQGNCEL